METIAGMITILVIGIIIWEMIKSSKKTPKPKSGGGTGGGGHYTEEEGEPIDEIRTPKINK